MILINFLAFIYYIKSENALYNSPEDMPQVA